MAMLSEHLGVSLATIRRDLEELHRRGHIRRVHGGAADPRRDLRPEADPRDFTDVALDAVDARRRIARAAAGLVDDGQVIALDIGTSVAAMCTELRHRELTVVTSSLAVVRALIDAPRIDLVVLGGTVRPSYQSMVGSLTTSAIRQLRVHTAFLGCAGVRPDGAVLDTTPSEVPVKKELMRIAGRTYLLADTTKLPGTGYLEIAPLTDFTALITDRDPGDYFVSTPDGPTPEVLLP